MKKITKILVSALLLMAMLLTMMPVVSAAGETQATTTGVSYYTGDTTAIANAKAAFKAGTKTDINTADEFVGFAQASHETNFAGKTITLKADLVFNEGNALDWKTTAPTQYPNWVAVGIGTGTNSNTGASDNFASASGFRGTFDGDGHTLSGIYINKTDGDDGFHGVFECLSEDALIKDLAIINSYITSGDMYWGGLAGRTWNCADVTISGCYVNAIIDGKTRGTGYIGGFVGHNSATNLVIENCIFAGTIYKVDGEATRVGGILGYDGGYNANFKSTIRDCVNIGHVSSYTQWGAALVACPQNLVIERCMSYGFSSSSNSNHGLVAAYRGDKAPAQGWTVKDCYIFSDKGQAFTTAPSSDTTTWGTISPDSVVSGTNYKSVNSSTLIGKVPTKFTGSTGNFPNWTARSGRMPMPSTVYANFAKYIDVYDSSSSFVDFANDDSIQYLYGSVFYNNYLTGKAKSGSTYVVKSFDIEAEEELVAFAKAAKAGYFGTNSAGYTFKLTRDMVFNKGNAADWETTAPDFVWMPVNNFSGTFNGQGYTVSGIYMNDSTRLFANENKDQYVGFFNYLEAGATVSNLGIVNSYYAASATYMGSIAARVLAASVTVDGCYSEAIMNNKTGRIGGIIGLVSGTGGDKDNPESYATIQNCVFNGTATSSGMHVGGIVAHGAQYQYNHVKLVNCANYGTLTGTTGSGALVGYGATVTLVNCLNAGTVTNTTEGNTNNALVGYVTGTNAAAVAKVNTNNCYNTNDAVLANGTTDAKTNVLKDTDKGTALFTSGWTARANIMGADYPMPTAVYNNFFKVALKYAQTTDVVNGVYTARIIARVDTHLYQKVGFKVIVNDGTTRKELKKEYCEFNYIFKTVTGSGTDGLTSVTAPGDTYFAAISLSDLPTTVTSIEIQPYTVGDDGEVTYGTAKTLNFNANGEYVGVAN